jgi:hypothetical protein
MYDQMWNNINRHILVVWQSIGVLVGALAIFALIEKNIISLDIASSLIVLLTSWMVAHLYDANHWYNRNLTIVGNIERSFLKPNDLCHIHWYFSRHRQRWSLLDHLQVQFWLGVGIALIILLHHFFSRVMPGLGSSLSNFEPARAFPYVTSIICVIALTLFRKKQREEFEKFLVKSPGITIQLNEINCGVHSSHPWYQQIQDG